MADLNALIAQGAQFRQAPDPFVQYGQMQQLEQNRQTNALNQMKMQEMQRGIETTNALNRAYQSNMNVDTGEINYPGVYKSLGSAGAGSSIPGIQKTQFEAAASKAAQQSSEAKTTETKQQILGQAYRDLSSRPDDEHLVTYGRDIQGSTLFSDAEKATVAARVTQLLKMPVEERKALLASQGAKSSELNVKPTPTNLAKLQTEMAALPAGDPRRNQYVSAIKKESESAPVAGSALSILLSEMAALPAGDPRRAEYAARIKKETTFAPGVTVTMPPQEKSFESGLGKGQSDRILANQVAAQDAAEILRTNQVGRDLLKSGAITGAGADFFVGLNKALKQGGIDFGYADAAVNSQAYGAAMAANTGKLIKQFGAGTAISDADREYATKAAAGQITMDEAAIRKVLDINDRASRNVIERHNKSVKNVKTNIPLEVELPPEIKAPAPSGASLIPTSTPAAAAVVPLGAIDKLLSGGGTDAQFDAIFGAGAAAGVRKRAKGTK